MNTYQPFVNVGFKFQNCKIYLCGTKKDIVEDSPSKRDVDVGTAQPLAAGITLSLQV